MPSENDNKLINLLDLKEAYDNSKHTQTAVSSPSASGTAVAFIDSISQNTNGVISPTKKTVAGATQSAAGLMSALDKAKLDGIASGAQVNSVTGVKGNAESTYRTGNVNLTPANIGAKATQSAVNDPTASGTAVAFIDSLSQNSQGVISPTKKTVQSASQSAAGLMSAADKKKLDGIASGAQVNSITGVKGNAESSYRTGNVNLTPANIGAFGTDSIGAITDANNTSLYGSRFFQANACANLPTNGSGVYYQVEFFGLCQMAFRYSSTGITETWGRYYTNNQWYPWVRIDKVTGIKGNAESTYRTGDVNLTPANIGALPISGGIMTGNIDMGQSGATSASKVLRWTTADGTVFDLRPYNNLFQLTRKPANGNTTNVLGITSDGAISVENPPGWRNALNITPANIGAHPARTNLQVTNNTDYTGNTTVSQPVAQILDTSNFIRHQLYGYYSSSGYFYTYLASRKPNGSSAVSNQIGIGFDADGNGVYSISYPAAFRNAIEAVAKSGDTMTGNLTVERAANDALIIAQCAATGGTRVALDSANSGIHGVWSAGYWNGSEFVTSGQWLIYRDTSGNIIFNGVVSVDHGGTGANTAYSGRRNLNASAGISLTDSDNTVAKVRQKLETIGNGETATIYLSIVPLNLITGRTADQYYLSGTVNRASADVFTFDLVNIATPSFRWAFKATITSTSASCGTIYKYTGTALT